MTRPGTPPPFSRPTVSEEERAAVEQVVGPLSDPELLRAVRDARGRTFQRLELLGDSVLDVVLAAHALLEAGCPGCRAGTRGADPGRLVTDQRLAEQARGHRLGAWLEWEASDDRLADLVEASVAAAWLAGGWAQVVPLAGAVVHPVGQVVTQVLEGDRGSTPLVGASSASAERRLGAAVLELAAAWAVYDERPDADEGELSQLRAQLHRTERVAAYARRTGLVPARGDADAVSDRVERWLADLLVSRGAASAVDAALRVLGRSRPGPPR